MANRLLLVVLCVAVGFAAGTYWTGSTKDTVRNHPQGSHTLPAPTIETGTRDAVPQISQSQTGVAVQNGARGIPAVRDLAETADISSEFLQSAALYLLAAPRDAAGIRQLLEDAKGALTGGDYRGATSLLVGRFAELDFPQALDYALENGGQSRASWLHAIFHARARIDVEDALASAQELANSQQQIAGLAMLRSNNQLTASQRRSIMNELKIPAHMVASTQHGTAEAWEELRDIADPMQRASAQAQVLMNWARSDPWAALDASAEMQNAEMSSAMQARLLGLAAADDPQRALDWLNAQPEGQQRDQLTAAVATQLAASDPDQAQAMLQGLPAEARMQAEMGLWSQRAAADPEGAAAWVVGLSNNDAGTHANVQLRMAPMQLLSVLGMTSAESADRFMNALPAEQRNQLESTYVQVLAQRDPAAAAGRISGISDEQQRRTASSSLVQVWGRSDPQQASRWVEQHSGETTAELYQALGSSWSQRDANGARDYAEGMRAGIDRDHMYSGILRSGRVAPNEVEAMAKQIDNQQLRGQAEQMQTLIRQSMSGALTSATMSSLQIMSDTSALSNMSSRRVISAKEDVNEDTGKPPEK